MPSPTRMFSGSIYLVWLVGTMNDKTRTGKTKMTVWSCIDPTISNALLDHENICFLGNFSVETQPFKLCRIERNIKLAIKSSHMFNNSHIAFGVGVETTISYAYTYTPTNMPPIIHPLFNLCNLLEWNHQCEHKIK